MLNIQLLGATGSIGTQAIEIIEEFPESFTLKAVTANHSVKKVLNILKRHPVEYVVMHKDYENKIKNAFPDVEFFSLEDKGLLKLVEKQENAVVLNALVGSVGLPATLKAIDTSKDVLLANKESLVVGGHLIKKALKTSESSLVPIDSEHSALSECMRGRQQADVETMIITASGGSFRDLPREALEKVTVHDALDHPNWSMGAKITIDSATMMNKVFEVVEAHFLFDMPYDKIDAIIHRESQVHALVHFKDGNVLAHMGPADMRIAILSALQGEKTHKYRSLFDLAKIGSLNFSALDREKYSLFDLGIAVAKEGGLHLATMNKANETAVALFLSGEIRYLEIETLIKRALDHFENKESPTLDTILAHEKAVEAFVTEEAKRR
ncbi:MAG: 1-deoxy-D-xylulose-5-phosphate reductoisomerase [Bacillota bacterium]